MFNIGLGELLFIAILALIFIGPERLPKVLRQLGEIVYELRQMTAQITSQFQEELEPVRELQNLAEGLDPRRQIGRALDIGADAAAKGKVEGATSSPSPSSSPTPGQTRANPMAMLTQARQAQSPEPPEPPAPPTPPPAAEA